jgi:hypothetical protein
VKAAQSGMMIFSDLASVLEHSSAEHVRRPAVPAESPTLGFTHLQFEALLTAARQSPDTFDFALVAMLGLVNPGIQTAPDLAGRRTHVVRSSNGDSLHRLGSCDDLAVGPAEGSDAVAGRIARPRCGWSRLPCRIVRAARDVGTGDGVVGNAGEREDGAAGDTVMDANELLGLRTTARHW